MKIHSPKILFASCLFFFPGSSFAIAEMKSNGISLSLCFWSDEGFPLFQKKWCRINWGDRYSKWYQQRNAGFKIYHHSQHYYSLKRCVTGPHSNDRDEHDIHILHWRRNWRQKVCQSFHFCKSGRNQRNKAYNEGIKQIRVSDPELTALIEEGKRKIVEYYDPLRCRNQNAQSAASLGNYGQAISRSDYNSDACKTCYDRGMTAAEPMYKNTLISGVMWNWQKRELHGMLSKMVMVPRKPAQRAEIEPTAACYKEATALNKRNYSANGWTRE